MRKFILVLTAAAATQAPLRAQLPTITNQPVSQDVSLGANVTFTVGVSGVGPFTYQWQFNATNLPGGIITTVAGNGANAPYGTFSGDGGAATNASLAEPSEVAVDASGDLFIADAYNNRIREVNTSGIITTVAGSGATGYGTGSFSGDGGAATSATLSQPFGVAVDSSGNLFVADYDNNRVRKVSTNGIITTIAGNGAASFSGDAGAATNASLNHPPGVAVDAAGNVFIADEFNQRVRKVSTNGIITTIAGNGSVGYSGDNGAATNAALNIPYGLAVDAAGNVFIADEANQRIRKVGTNGIITTVAGNGTTNFSGDGGAATNASLDGPSGVAVDASGNLFMADSSNSRIRKVSATGIITTVAGNGTTNFSGDGGAATNAGLNEPVDVVVDAAGNLFLSEYGNQRIRKVVNTQAPVLALNDVSAANAGNYQVIVIGAGGSVTSSVALLAVGTPVSRTWNGSASSDWFNATNWTPAGVPGPFDTINFTNGALNLTAPVTSYGQFNWFGGTLSGSGLTLASSGALGISGSVVLSGTLALNGLATISGNGQLTLSGGTVAGGTVVATNGTSLIVSSGTLDGVTFDGTLDVGNTVNAANLTVLDNLTLNGTALVGNPINGNWGVLNFVGSQTLGGSGTVIFGNAGNCNGSPINGLRLASGGTTLSIGAAITVEGQNGTIGWGASCDNGGPYNVGMINNGTISASVAGGNIYLNFGSGWTNFGTINLATNSTLDLGGTFTLANLGTFNRSAGTVNLTGLLNNTNTTLNLGAYGGSWVLNGGEIAGGTVVATNGASLIVSSGTLDGVTFDGTLDVGNTFNAASLTVLDNLTLNGTALVGSPVNGNWGVLNFVGSQTLGGNGAVIFGNAGNCNGSPINGLRLASGGTTLDIGAAITVEGQNGTIGWGASCDNGGPYNVGMINNGIISASVAGGNIYLNFGSGWTNAGTISLATNSTLDLGGTFTLANLGTFNRSAGTVNLTGFLNNTNTSFNLGAYGGSWVLNGGEIAGGTVVATNGASLIVNSGTLDGVTFDGTLDVGNTVNAANLTVLDNLTLNGTALVGNPINGDWGVLNFVGSQTLGGNGTVIFGNAGNCNGSPINGLRLASGGTTLDIGAGITVEGQNGTIGWGASCNNGGPYNVGMINNGTISASVAGGNIYLNFGSGWTNAGTINLTTNSTLDLGGTFTLANLGTFNRSAGTVNLTGFLNNTNTSFNLGAYGGSWVLNGGEIAGGTVVATNGASLIVNSGTLDGVTFDGTLDVGNTVNAANLTVLDNLTLNGTALVGNPINGDWGVLNFVGSQTLGGNGTVIFGNAGNCNGSPINGLRLASGGTTLDIGAGITVEGQNGTIGWGASCNNGGPYNVGMINNGTISASVAGGNIYLNFGSGWTNAGTINLATNSTLDLGGTFTLANLGTFNRSAGTVNLIGLLNNTNTSFNLGAYGGSWMLNGGEIAGGTVVATNGASLIVNSGTLDGVTFDGTLDVGNTVNAASLTVLDNLTLNGTALVGNPVNGNWGVLDFVGSQTLGGNGAVVFGNAGFCNGSPINGLRLASGGTTLSIGAAITVEGQNGTIGWGASCNNGGPYNVGMINNGTISASVAGGNIYLNFGSGWTNFGTINLATNSTLDLGGTFTLANLGTFNRSAGTVNLIGLLNNTNTSFNLGAYGGSWMLNGGEIAGGTVVATNGASLIVNSGTLDGVTFDGTLDVGNTVNAASLTVLDNLTLNGTALVGSPVNGNWGVLNFVGSQTLGGNGTVIFGNAGNCNGSPINGLRLASGGTTLDIGAGITVEGQNGTIGWGASCNNGGPYNVGVINQGTISCDVTGGTVAINAQTFTNFNTLDVESGVINLNGAFAQVGGTWTFGLNGPGNYGQLLISGGAPVGGTLNVNLNNGYLPSLNSSFALVSYGSASGSFAVTNLPTQGLFWNLQYTPTNISLKVTNYITPVVNITSPSNGASFTAPANIPLAATATDANAAITKVEFYQGSTKLGQVFSAPYTLTWSNVPPGLYALWARATDAVGATATSNPVNIHVYQPPSTNYFWVGSLSSDWFTQGNWSPVGVPGSQDGAYITNGGSVVLSSSTTIASFNLSSGTLGGNGTLTPTNGFNWTGGSVGCPVTVPTNAVLNINGNVTLSNVLNNAGTINWLGGNIAVQNSTFYGGVGAIVNSSGGAWNIECDQQMYDPNGYLGNPSFQNAGTVTKTAGTNTTFIGIPFYTTGTASILAGTLNLTNGGTIEGSFNVTTGAVVSFSGGNFGIGGAFGASFTAQQVLIGTNTLANGSAAVTIYTNASVIVTNFSGTAYVDVGAGGTLTLDGGLLQLDSLILTNGGTFTNLAGSLVCPHPYEIENGGSISIDGGSITTSTNFTLGTFGGSTGVLVVANGGTLNILNSTLGIGDNGSLTNGSGLGIVTVSNGLLNAAAINLGSTTGGLGSLAIQSGGTVTVSSNLTAVSGSLSSTSMVSVAGGTLNVPDGAIAIGPSGTGLMTIDNTTNFSVGRGGGPPSVHVGSVTAQSVKLGGTPSIGSGGLYLNAGFLTVSRISANFIIVNGGDLDGSGGTIIIGEDHDAAMVVSAGTASNAATMYVGYSPGYTGTFTQSGGVVSINTNLVVGVSNSTGIATLSGGVLYVTNAAHTATLNVLQGSFLMSGGTLVADILIATNGGAGTFNHTGGTLICGQIQQSASAVSVVPNLVLDGGASAGVGTGSIGGPGTLYVTNASHTGTLNIGNGTFLLSTGGTLVVDTLIITNSGGRFIRNGGTLVMNNPPVLDPNSDADGDGQSNTNEMRAGTDPLDPNSFFETLGATKTSGANIKVTWTTEGGHSYVVQMATNTATGPSRFVDLSPVIAVGGSGPGTTNYVHVGATTNRIGYYRVRLGP